MRFEVTLELVKVGCTRDSIKYCLSNRVIKEWNQLDHRAVNAFNNKSDTYSHMQLSGYFVVGIADKRDLLL